MPPMLKSPTVAAAARKPARSAAETVRSVPSAAVPIVSRPVKCAWPGTTIAVADGGAMMFAPSRAATTEAVAVVATM